MFVLLLIFIGLVIVILIDCRVRRLNFIVMVRFRIFRCECVWFRVWVLLFFNCSRCDMFVGVVFVRGGSVGLIVLVEIG